MCVFLFLSCIDCFLVLLIYKESIFPFISDNIYVSTDLLALFISPPPFFCLSGKFLKTHILINFTSNCSAYLNPNSPQFVVIFPKALKYISWHGLGGVLIQRISTLHWIWRDTQRGRDPSAIPHWNTLWDWSRAGVISA